MCQHIELEIVYKVINLGAFPVCACSIKNAKSEQIAEMISHGAMLVLVGQLV